MNKLILFTFGSVLFSASLSFALPGKYLEPTETAIVGYSSAKECKKDNGKWDTHSELCLFEMDNEVLISEKSNKFKVIVHTIGSNGHECGFESENVEVISENKLVAREKVDVSYDENLNECIVNFMFSKNPAGKEIVSVTNNGACQEFCGARAWLEVSDAEKLTRVTNKMRNARRY